MKYTAKPTTQFKKDLKKAQKRGYDLELLKYVIKKLSDGETLDEKYKDHPLIGNYSNRRECHIQPDWLLIYQIVESDLILVLTRTGTHSDLF
ncbi:MAG: type II toxin-antitoxin system YafQ family toxin [Anaerolineaceae bacterium]|nr:type II toxin-antitoxin system YafQ family toxin [Anaerolineaceae bacterium]